MKHISLFCFAIGFLGVPCLRAEQPKDFTVMVYNVENLADVDRVAPYDDYVEAPDDPNSYGPAKMAKKLKTIATVMKSIGNGVGPDVVILNELEADHTPRIHSKRCSGVPKKIFGYDLRKDALVRAE